jgi:hypothetical protein
MPDHEHQLVRRRGGLLGAVGRGRHGGVVAGERDKVYIGFDGAVPEGQGEGLLDSAQVWLKGMEDVPGHYHPASRHYDYEPKSS